ncbi:NAD(P)/FAD-dependent oxidoreductase [Thalassovita mangrovi]|uniref:FAD-dependent oxidoreductase n=1 Tax=Thalassovita mangrovi TaxID=2692236 RepID=A0A6L8LND2_9RHOB|nr:FAD-dependent oxidoreductase [Thalassovita mangrovi]MYM57547.1 FAD-dependent oxidoreductase [Thalassovita mangrovi]
MAGVVIIGAGHGGTQLAAGLRDEGYAGTIDLISADPDHPYHKPPLSKSFMKAEDAPLQPLRAPVFFADKDIRLHLGQTATGIDRAAKTVTLADGATLPYAALVLATGTEARRLTLPGHDLPGVHTLRTASDARALRGALPGVARVVVIGGGFIGLEAAAMLAGRGIAVTVAELAPRLLGRAASAEVAQAVAHELEALGVRVLTGVSVEAIEGEGRVAAVRLGTEVLAADLVIVGIGAVPVDGLARAADLTVENGVVVDAHLATSDPHIFALGDCASFPAPGNGRHMRLESVQNATDQARALAATLAGKPTAYGAVPWFWSDIGPMKLQIAGLIGAADEAITTHGADGRLKSVYHLAAGRLVAVETLNSAGEHMLARRLLTDGVTPPRDVLATGDAARIKAAWQDLTATA